MKPRNKAAGVLHFLVIPCCFLLLTCFNPLNYNNKTTLNVTFSAESEEFNAKAAANPEDIRCTLDFSGPEKQRFSRTVGIGERISLGAAPGRWYISANAYLSGKLYATGAEATEVKEGQKNNVNIKLRLLSVSDANGTPPPPSTPPPAPVTSTPSVSISGTAMYNETLTAVTSGFTGSSPSYEWYVGGSLTAISTSSYTIVNSSDRTKQIYVEVTDTVTGENSASPPLTIHKALPVNNESELSDIGNTALYTLGEDYILRANITLTGPFIPIGNGSTFTGTFDGDGHYIDLGYNNISSTTIYGLQVFGLFGYIDGATAEVKNLKLTGTIIIPSTLATANYAGGLTGVNGGTIKNVASEIIIDTPSPADNPISAGGIAGWNDPDGIIEDCSYIGNISLDTSGYVTGNPLAGGIAGETYGIILRCLASGTVSTIVTNLNEKAGGICGYITKASMPPAIIENCVALNSIIQVGGLVFGTYYGRIVGHEDAFGNTQLTNNYANSGMTVIVNSLPVSVTGTSGDLHGQDFTSSGQSAWTGPGTPGWTIHPLIDGDETHPWVWDSTAIPPRPKLWFN